MIPTPTRMMGPLVRDVVTVVAELTGFHPLDLKSQDRQRDVTDARHIACWVAYQCGYGASYPLIGRVLGHRDHTTVMHAVHRVTNTPALLEMAELIAHDVRERFNRSQQEQLPIGATGGN